MIYKFIDRQGTFVVQNPQKYHAYFPLTDSQGRLLSSISANLAGDIKMDNEHFLTPPASIEDTRSNLLCRRDFFIKTDKDIIRLSYPGKNDILQAGFLYHKIIKKASSLLIEVINFVPYDLGVEVMWVKIRNQGNRAANITPTSFLPLYGRGEANLRDHRHVTSLLNRIDLARYGIFLKPSMVFSEKGHKINQAIYFVLGYEGECLAPAGQFPTLDYFYGEGDLIRPDAIYKNVRPLDKDKPGLQGKEACAAFRFKERKIRKGEEVNYILIAGIDKDKGKINRAFRALNSPQKVSLSLEATRRYWLKYLARLDFDFKDKDFNNWLLWVKLQPTLRKLFGCSYLPHFDYGKGGRGWRDLWQDILTLLLSEPEKARHTIVHNFKGVRIDGSNATIITKDGDFIADRNRISRVWMDHGVWPYLTLSSYINRTGDLDILSEEAPYFKDHQLKRARDIDTAFTAKDYLLRARNKKVYQGSILEHVLIQNLVQFFNVGEHNIIRLENADWNDGLDMAPERGESAAFSFMYAHNLKDICGLLEALKQKKRTVKLAKELSLLLDRINKPVDYVNYKAKQKRLDEYLQKTRVISGAKTEIEIDDLIRDLRDKSSHLALWLNKKEWLKEGFYNGYYDNLGLRVEGRRGNKTRMMLESQVFAIMSGVSGQEQVKKSWQAIKKYLQDKKTGGFRLNTDFGLLYLNLGRAFGFSYGDKENGAFFNHMVVMLANGLYKRGLKKEGFEAMNSIYKMSTNPSAAIYPSLPEYFDSNGRGLYLYLTGSASWYIYTLLEEVLGIKFKLGRIYLQPNLVADNFLQEKIEVSFYLKGKRAKAVFTKKVLGKETCKTGKFLKGGC